MKQIDCDLQEILESPDIYTGFKGKTVLITGATGLIGSMLVRTFHAANEKYGLEINIIGQIRNQEKAWVIFEEILECEDLHFLIDYDGECDYIFHTASPTASAFFVEHPVETIIDSVYGTRNALELAKKNNAVMVYLSSMEQYGVPQGNDVYMTEDKVGEINHLSIRSSYSEGKRLCECLCASYNSEYKVDVKIARLAQTFGAGIPKTDNRMPMQFANAVIKNENIILHTAGKSYSNYVYITDAITGLLTISLKGESGQAYNICYDKETRTVYEIAKLIAKEIANNHIDVLVEENSYTGYAPDVKMFLCSDKLRNLGWTPRIEMCEGYKRLVNYLKDKEFDII